MIRDVLVPGELFVAQRPTLGDEPPDLDALRVRFEVVAERREERVPHVRERHAVLRPFRPRHRGHDRRQVEVEDLAERRLGIAVAPEHPLLLRVALGQVDAVAPAGEGEVAHRLRVHREVGRRSAVLRAHVRQRGSVRDRQRRQSVTEELHELAHHAVRAEHLGERQHEVGGGGPGRQRAGHAHADHHRLWQEHRLAQHRGFGLDAAHAPPQDAEPVDHRRVRVGAHERVGERHAVAR